MNNFNFLKPKKPQINITRLFGVYISSFVFIFGIFNLQFILSGATSLADTIYHREDYEEETRILQEYYHNHPLTIADLDTSPSPIVSSKPNNNIIPNQNESVFSASITIPKLGIKAPIVWENSNNEKKLLGALERGVLVYPGSSEFGQSGGVTVIVGHSSSNNPFSKYGRVFSGLPKLAAGDIIYINYNGKDIAYVVNNKITGTVGDLTKANMSGNLILGSCWPIGTDKGRILISAVMQEN